MGSIYDSLIGRVVDLRTKDLPTEAQAKLYRNVLATVVGFLEALKDKGYVTVLEEFTHPNSVAYFCRFDNGKELVVCCGGTIDDHGRVAVRTGLGNKARWTEDKPLTRFYPATSTPEDGLGQFELTLNRIIEMAGERPPP